MRRLIFLALIAIITVSFVYADNHEHYLSYLPAGTYSALSFNDIQNCLKQDIFALYPEMMNQYIKSGLPAIKLEFIQRKYGALLTNTIERMLKTQKVSEGKGFIEDVRATSKRLTLYVVSDLAHIMDSGLKDGLISYTDKKIQGVKIYQTWVESVIDRQEVLMCTPGPEIVLVAKDVGILEKAINASLGNGESFVDTAYYDEFIQWMGDHEIVDVAFNELSNKPYIEYLRKKGDVEKAEYTQQHSNDTWPKIQVHFTVYEKDKIISYQESHFHNEKAVEYYLNIFNPDREVKITGKLPEGIKQRNKPKPIPRMHLKQLRKPEFTVKGTVLTRKTVTTIETIKEVIAGREEVRKRLQKEKAEKK